jgi:hypothetical protein
MVKWALSIGGAFALLAVTLSVAAYELDEDGGYVFYDDDELMAFAEKLAEEEVEEQGGGGWLDACYLCRPVAYLLVTVHDEGEETQHSHTDTDIYWDSENEYYYACYNYKAHMYSNVDRILAYWKTTSAACCDYCDWDDWEAYHFNPWSTMETQNCDNTYSPSIYYWGNETTDYDDHDYTTGNYFAEFERTGTMTDSAVRLVYCVE